MNYYRFHSLVCSFMFLVVNVFSSSIYSSLTDIYVYSSLHCSSTLMALPGNLKAIQPYLKVANDMRKREPVVAYHCDMHAMQTGMKIDSKSPDCKKFLLQLMTSLETQKVNLSKDPEKKEQISSDVCSH